MENMLHVQSYADLIYSRRLRREHVFRDGAHRLDAYDGMDVRSSVLYGWSEEETTLYQTSIENSE